MNSITTRTKRTLSGLIAALFALSLVAVPSAALAAAPFLTPDSTNYNQSIAVGEGLTTLTAFDPDGDLLTFSTGGGLPEGITLNAEGTFSGVATTAGVFGTLNSVCDPLGACDMATLTVTVSSGISPEPSDSPTPAPSASPNQPPLFAARMDVIFVGEGLAGMSPSFDPDGDAVTFSLIEGNLPDGITLNADGTFSGVVTTTGLFFPQFQGCDPFGACGIQLLSVRVSEPSVSPSPSASPIVTPTPQPSASPVVTPTPQPKKSTPPLANTSMEGPLGGTPAQLPEILLGFILLSLGAGTLASNHLRQRFLRQR